MLETSVGEVPMPKTRNIANDVHATAKRYCRLSCRVPAESLFPYI